MGSEVGDGLASTWPRRHHLEGFDGFTESWLRRHVERGFGVSEAYDGFTRRSFCPRFRGNLRAVLLLRFLRVTRTRARM